jgi:enamine deaminase RidA (YjgF/YER057c/UK114 family)
MIEERLKELGLDLPEAAKPSFIYVPVVVHNGVAYISGQLPKVNGEVKITGKVGADVSIEDARKSARICILQALSCLKQEIGSLDLVERIIKVTGFVNSANGFNQQPKVIDAASELIEQIFGEIGRHARSAVGASELPRSTPVEIEMIVAVKTD